MEPKTPPPIAKEGHICPMTTVHRFIAHNLPRITDSLCACQQRFVHLAQLHLTACHGRLRTAREILGKRHPVAEAVVEDPPTVHWKNVVVVENAREH